MPRRRDIAELEWERMVAKPEWGSKRICPSCGARYYDLLREPVICPKCATPFDAEEIDAEVETEEAEAAEEEEEEEAVPLEEAEEEDEELLEDASELGEDEDDMAEVIENVEEEEH